MSSFTVIQDVGLTMVGLLRDNMADVFTPGTDLKAAIVLGSPAEVKTIQKELRLLLFLYAIRIDEHHRNEEVTASDFLHRRRPPVALDLHYMLTPYHPESISVAEGTLLDHKILGRAMQVFHDYSILKGSILRGDLNGSTDEFWLVQSQLSVNDMSEIWSTFSETFYRLSAFYTVSPVRIDPMREREVGRVVEGTVD